MVVLDVDHELVTVLLEELGEAREFADWHDTAQLYARTAKGGQQAKNVAANAWGVRYLIRGRLAYSFA